MQPNKHQHPSNFYFRLLKCHINIKGLNWTVNGDVRHLTTSNFIAANSFLKRCVHLKITPLPYTANKIIYPSVHPNRKGCWVCAWAGVGGCHHRGKDNERRRKEKTINWSETGPSNSYFNLTVVIDGITCLKQPCSVIFRLSVSVSQTTWLSITYKLFLSELSVHLWEPVPAHMGGGKCNIC